MTSLSEKTCTACGQKKAIRHFWRRTASRDGFSAGCIACRQAERRRRTSRPDEKARRRLADAEWRRNNRARSRAYYLLSKALEKGKIKRPKCCPNCGDKTMVVANFIKVEEPPEFVWLCRQCMSDRFWKRT